MSEFVSGIQGIEAALAQYQTAAEAAFVRACQKIMVLLANYAKQNHPWKDQTGNTTNSIDCQITEADAEHIVVTLWAGMDYDIFLELAHDGKWAWLWDAVVKNLDNIRQILKDEGLPVEGVGAVIEDLAVGHAATELTPGMERRHEQVTLESQRYSRSKDGG